METMNIERYHKEELEQKVSEMKEHGWKQVSEIVKKNPYLEGGYIVRLRREKVQ